VNDDASWNNALRFDEHGLIAAVVQDRLTGEVRMLAWMNEAALRQTLKTGLATFFSRSRQALWVKGEMSGHRLSVHSVTADCDGDTLLVLVDPVGPSCHTGARNCFFRGVTERGVIESAPVRPFIEELEAVIEARRDASGSQSYTRKLLDGGAPAIGDKVREEAAELVQALAGESEERVASEAADLVFHAMVGLALRGVDWRNVVGVLAARFGVSGLTEKAQRSRPQS
jgi:phosphoribosyl-ATP pyrophosphohydrolase/phosphoribosyl-AMP cyclohydrolase